MAGQSVESMENAENAAADAALVAARAGVLGLHSPTHFLRELPAAPQQLRYGTGADRKSVV